MQEQLPGYSTQRFVIIEYGTKKQVRMFKLFHARS